MLNDGRNPWDNVDNYQTYLAYKNFVEDIEKKALDTLRFCVQKLVTNFEKEQEVKMFSSQEKESKREALTRLMSLMYDKEYKKDAKKGQVASES